jgi:hypothetical protein
VGQLTDALIPSSLVPVQPLLLGLGNFTPSHQVHDEQTRIPPVTVYPRQGTSRARLGPVKPG